MRRTITTTIVIIITSYNNKWKFKQELNIHHNDENDTNTSGKRY